MRLPTFLFYFILLFTIVCVAIAAVNSITVDQIGDGNNIHIEQVGTGHTAKVNLGAGSNVDYTTLTIMQQGTGAKTAEIEIKSGIANATGIVQDGAGNHTASIKNLIGNGNTVNITQSGAGKHEFNVVGGTGASTSGTTVSGNQSGGVGAEKWFNVWLNGSTGATVNVVQDGNTVDQASMNIQCLSGTCGTFSYIKH